MADIKISINAPSYKRSGKVKTLDYIPDCQIWVDEGEYEEYKKNNPKGNIIPCKKGIQGNLCRIRNHIIDTEYKKGFNAVLIIDDDLQYLGYFERNSKVILKYADIMPFLYKYTLICKEFGSHLWGINVGEDKQFYREYTPFSLNSYIGGPFAVHFESDLRYDERLPLKEDYDLTLQHCNRYRKVLRVNKFFYRVRQAEQSGGMCYISE